MDDLGAIQEAIYWDVLQKILNIKKNQTKESFFNEKLKILNSIPSLDKSIKENKVILKFLTRSTIEEEIAIKSIFAIGQANIVFNCRRVSDPENLILPLLEHLKEIESFYEEIGGIIGYHYTVLKLIQECESQKCESQKCESQKCQSAVTTIQDPSLKFLKPIGLDISEFSPEIFRVIIEGIAHLPQVAEIYPVGGAGDRLSLQDNATGEPLPAACLNFCGRSLIDGLLRDIQAKEYLFYKLFRKQITLPVAMMTSDEKENHRHILQILEENHWYHRPKRQFFVFKQPLVPVITKEGNWSLAAPFTLSLKPGGHGVIWKLADASGVLDSLASLGVKKCLIRQINNPIAAIDYGLLAFLGTGFCGNKAFGFSSCPRLLDNPEGMNVLQDRILGNKHEYCITNIEYTETKKRGFHEVPEFPGSPYSTFPANTNILFADIESIKGALKRCAIPGMLINMKNKTPYIDEEGNKQEVEGGRLESIMQNIADYIVDSYPNELPENQLNSLKTFIVFNERRKTISVTKNSYRNGGKIEGTPEGCFFDLLQNCADLLKNWCRIQVPDLGKVEDYIKNGPAFAFYFHPCLGPLFSIIGEKIRGGKLAKESDLNLEIAELNIENLELDGSLSIVADSVAGHLNENNLLVYSNQTGKCTLKNVAVKNQGIDWSAENIFWKRQLAHREQMEILLHGNGEFYAENVTFLGSHKIEVPDGHRMVAAQSKQHKGKVDFHLEKIAKPTWHWDYFIDEKNHRFRLRVNQDRE